VNSTGPSLASLHWPRHTARLLLRPATDADADAVFEYRRRADVATYLSRGPLTREEVLARFASDAERAAAGHPEPFLGLVIERDGAVIGDCMVRLQADDNGMWAGILGYTIHPGHAGIGLATEVACELVRTCFDDLHVATVTADVFVPHRASQRVLEKAGLRRVAHKPAGSEGEGRPRLDDYVYAVTAAEWAAHRAG